jgi:succinate dehydrogenase / fumarate reductase, membrane anchor subunit
MSGSNHLRHPIAVARGLGAAKDGTHHFWIQRLTAVALMLLSPWFVWLLLSLIGADYATIRLSLAQPVTATLLLAFIIALFWHVKLGLQVVVEDYIHVKGLEFALQIAITFACLLAVLASVVALGRIVFAG